ncbi:neuroligin-3-like isoform X2 [Oppia nitens]|uniref:neuroligin-3-like isoform X2 n=1 Tax=Oppia nitens TaxID=1686743 RepID=UPI0023DC806D|nr:neuroligin-3-like isoform X2 [Oppia nitens]
MCINYIGREMVHLPVLMFIHGESYEWNAGSSYDGSVLASYANVVVVTINYRIGVLGFFPSLDGTARGNFGLMDQVAALHWIQENIREFGGDEANVTVMGHGHGAACINFLMLSPMARGLFHRAIMQSGSALSPWAVASDAVLHSRNLAKALRCPDEPDKNSVMVDCLRQRSVEDIIAVDLRVPTHLTAFGPVIDGIVIPNDPAILMSDPNSFYANYDLMFGVTNIEAYNQFTAQDERNGIDPQRRDRLLRTLVRNLFSYHLQEIFLTIVNEYTDWTRPALHPISTFDSIANSFGDALIVAPIIRAGLMHSKTKKSTYFYNFGYQTEEGDFTSRSGCIHGQDLAYLFGAPLVSGMQFSFFSNNYSRAEASLSENVMTYWTNFAKNGDPNGVTTADANAKGRVQWPPYDDIQQQYLTIAMKPKTRDHYHAHKLSYWLNLLPQLHTPGPSNAEAHHLLESHDDPLSYDGVVRSNSLTAPTLLSHYFTTHSTVDMNVETTVGSFATTSNSSIQLTHSQQKPNSAGPVLADKNHQQSALDSVVVTNNSSNASVSMIVQQSTYSTALSVTIAIGCSLLILNVLVFAGVFYQRDKNRLEAKLIRKNYQAQKMDDMNILKNTGSHSPLKQHSSSMDNNMGTVGTVHLHNNSIQSEYVPGMGSSSQKHSHNSILMTTEPTQLSCHVPIASSNRSTHVSMANTTFHNNSVGTLPRMNHKMATIDVINTGSNTATLGHQPRHTMSHEMRV